MSEELNAPNPTDVGDGADVDASGTGGMTLEDAISTIASLRKENAAKRVKTREAEKGLAEFEEWKKSQMSESEKLVSERDEALNTLTSAWSEIFAEKYNVPETRRRFVTGKTKEEIEESAKVLGEAKATQEAGPPVVEAPNLFPGVRGKPTGSKASGTSFDDVLRAQLRA